jgi:hypothetical protein
MIVDYDDSQDGYTPVWKCLGCGRSLYVDPARLAEDNRLRAGIVRALGQGAEHA